MSDPADPSLRPQRLLSISSVLTKWEEVILSAGVLAIATLASLNIVCRTLFGFSLAVTEELIQFCVILLCFVGMSYAAARGRHIRMTAVYDLYPPDVRRRWMVAIAAVTTLLFAALTYFAVRYVQAVYELGGIYPATRVPFWIIYLMAPLGFGLTTMQFAATTWRNLTTDQPFVSALVPDREYETSREHESSAVVEEREGMDSDSANSQARSSPMRYNEQGDSVC